MVQEERRWVLQPTHRAQARRKRPGGSGALRRKKEGRNHDATQKIEDERCEIQPVAERQVPSAGSWENGIESSLLALMSYSV